MLERGSPNSITHHGVWEGECGVGCDGEWGGGVLGVVGSVVCDVVWSGLCGVNGEWGAVWSGVCGVMGSGMQCGVGCVV